MDAYHRYVLLGCIAQGILQHLSLRFRKEAWAHFISHSWMRTMTPSKPPSEAVVAHALKVTLPEFLMNSPQDHTLKLFLLHAADLERCRELQLAG